MKITLSSSDTAQVKELLRTKDDNIRAADMFLFYLENDACSVDKSLLEKQKALANATDEQAYVQLMAKHLGLDSRNKQDKELMTKYLFKGVSKLSPASYRDNPYYKNVRVKPVHEGAWELRYEPYDPYEAFIYDDALVDEHQNYLERTRMGFFDEPFEFLAVAEKGVTWMSITPNEIETMREAIDASHGRVITLGLGLGYFAYMASIKANVESVTIIETNPQIITMFQKYILPQFPSPEKIRIIRQDAFDYVAKTMTPSDFDFAFVDLWHGGEDGLPLYLQMKKWERKFPQTTFAYWLETSLLVMLRRCVLTLLEEEMAGSTDEAYQKAETPIDTIINALHKLLKQTRVSSYQEAYDLVLEGTLKRLAEKIL